MLEEIKTERLGIRITKTLKQKLKSLAKERGLSASVFVCEILECLPPPRKSTTPEPTPSPELTYFSRETPKTLKVAEASTGYEV